MNRLEDMDEREISDAMMAAAATIERIFRINGVREKPKFCLVVFSDPKVAQYISNCQRTDMIAAMRETADRIERNQDVRR
jgi:hypothetical protein